MSKYSRDKGKRGEANARALIFQLTGVYLKRNSNQSDSGGYDLVVDEKASKTEGLEHRAAVLGRFAIEVKNTAQGFAPVYWRQTVEQASAYSREPLLLYNIPLKGFRAVIHVSSLPVPSREWEEGDIVHLELPTLFKLLGIHHS